MRFWEQTGQPPVLRNLEPIDFSAVLPFALTAGWANGLYLGQNGVWEAGQLLETVATAAVPLITLD